jgi:hypothetical protein
MGVFTDSATPAGRFFRLVVVASLVGGLANLGVSIVVPAQSRALHDHSGASLGALLAEEQTHVAERYQIYGQLRDLADGAAVTIPRNMLDAYVLEHLAGMTVTTEVNQRRIPDRVLAAILPDVRYEGVTETRVGAVDVRPYIVATSVDTPERLEVYVLRDSGTIIVLDRALADANGLP